MVDDLGGALRFLTEHDEHALRLVDVHKPLPTTLSRALRRCKESRINHARADSLSTGPESRSEPVLPQWSEHALLECNLDAVPRYASVPGGARLTRPRSGSAEAGRLLRASHPADWRKSSRNSKLRRA